MEISIYTDGSVVGNKRSGNGKGGIGVYGGLNNCLNISEKYNGPLPVTNQRTELYAIITALNYCKTLDLSLYKITIYSDSLYSINVITKKWKAKENLDLIKQAWELFANTSNIVFQHVRSHTGNQDQHSICNDIADKLSRSCY